MRKNFRYTNLVKEKFKIFNENIAESKNLLWPPSSNWNEDSTGFGCDCHHLTGIGILNYQNFKPVEYSPGLLPHAFGKVFENWNLINFKGW